MKKKSIIALLLAMILCLGLASCGNEETETYPDTEFATLESILGFEDGTTFMYDGNEYEATVDIKPITNGYVYEYTFTGDDIGALNVGDPFNYESALQNYEKLEITDELISWGQTVMGEVGYVVTSIYGYTDSTGNILFKTQRNGTDYLGGYCQYSIAIYYK